MMTRGVVPILLYHKIARPTRGTRTPGQYVSPGLFGRHLDYLLGRGYRTVSLRDLVASGMLRGAAEAVPGGASGVSLGPELPERPVVITFDDGYRCLYEQAFPALVERGMKATVFLVMEGLGRSNFWEQAMGSAAEPMLGLSEVKEMRGCGIEYGVHTLTHAHLTRVSEGEAEQEIFGARARFEEMLEESCCSFAYPYGEWNSQVRGLVAKAGYEAACTTVRRAARPGDDPLALPRINIRRYNVIARFAYKLWRAERREP